MERITYILGAGFSAPLGLPVMRDFLTKSKDLYFSDTPSYKHFEQVFSLIRNLSVTKNYFESDLFNIEEILSILEMQVFVEKRRLKKAFIQYICDVINHCTPSMEYQGLPGNWQNFVFGRKVMQRMYGHFFGNILGINFEYTVGADETARRFVAHIDNSRDRSYSIVTLNYDMVPENFASFVNEHYETQEIVKFDDQSSKASDNRGPVLAKLHGSADSGVIVPPTWAKGTHRKIASTWKRAFEVLENSNQIRFIGYSLPVGDDYLKYLLKAAVVGAENLKKIDVICLDPYGDVEERYGRHIRFNYFRFKNATTQEYLKAVPETSSPSQPQLRAQQRTFRIDGLEKAHAQFMDR